MQYLGGGTSRGGGWVLKSDRFRKAAQLCSFRTHAWLDVTAVHADTAVIYLGNARTYKLLARPPRPVDVLITRVTAVLLAAHTRLGHISGGVGGGALVGRWSMETLQIAFNNYPPAQPQPRRRC